MAKLPSEKLNQATKDSMDAIASKYQTQIDKFREASRELETDNDEKRFDETLKKLAAQKPKDDGAR